jgi:amino acid permease
VQSVGLSDVPVTVAMTSDGQSVIFASQRMLVAMDVASKTQRAFFGHTDLVR